MNNTKNALSELEEAALDAYPVSMVLCQNPDGSPGERDENINERQAFIVGWQAAKQQEMEEKKTIKSLVAELDDVAGDLAHASQYRKWDEIRELRKKWDGVADQIFQLEEKHWLDDDDVLVIYQLAVENSYREFRKKMQEFKNQKLSIKK
jgi:hypothetical protein